ncbi:NADH-quinone oxidoreductase subunit J [candidate division KSB1 bacterium]|nr:MAG: NADH-quinone oxidoreductase subunit J [candidate division KSB1 bacterium]
METILFAAFALCSILAALLTITAPAPIASALYLVVTMLCLAGLYVLLAAPFVAAIQVIVYAGAVIVLILFVIMLLNLKPIEERIPAAWRIAGIVIAALILMITFLSIMSVSSLLPTATTLPETFGKVNEISGLLFSKYLYAFEVVSVLLLLAVVGAVSLIRKPDAGGTDAN